MWCCRWWWSQRSAGAGLGNGRARGDEQPGADAAANGDHAQVPGRQGSFQSAGGFLAVKIAGHVARTRHFCGVCHGSPFYYI